MSKVILSTDAPKPFTVERRNRGGVVLELHLNRMSLGTRSTKWLYDALANAIRQGETKEQGLEYENKRLLTLINDSKYCFLIGQNSRFVMSKDVGRQLLEYLETNI